MDANQALRIVALRRGKIKPGEFKLREGEKGLSLFLHVKEPSPSTIVEAVRAAGKRGDLGVAVISEGALTALGLVLVKTNGGTQSEEVNRVHLEARVPWLRRFWLWLRFRSLTDYFNQEMSPRINVIAHLMEGEWQ
jgi:hypothetical protein